jgi:hypothetical protein
MRQKKTIHGFQIQCTPHIILWFTPHGDHTRNKKLGDDFYIISTTFSFNILAFNLLEMCIIKNRNTRDLTNGDQLGKSQKTLSYKVVSSMPRQKHWLYL